MALLWPGEDGFEEAAVGRVFNARRPDWRPAAVMLASSEDDVVDAVRVARDRGLKVSVRSGGHSWAAWSVRPDAVLIDLGGMQEMTFDASTGIATASPSIQGGGQFAPFLESHGRMFPGGHCTTVGLGGFLMQGGQGWNCRRWGWGCENVVAVDVVLADGSLVRADAEQNRGSLLGGARGGPGLLRRRHAAAPADLRAAADDAGHVDVRALGDRGVARVAARPDADARRRRRAGDRRDPVAGRAALRGRRAAGRAGPALHTTVSTVDAAEAALLLAPMHACPLADRALGHVTGPTTIAEENAAQDIQNPTGYRYRVDCQWTNAPAAELAPLLRALWSELPTEHSFSIWYGWAPTRALPDMAFSLEANVYLATYVIYPDAADDERYSDWLQSHMTGLAAIGEGVYLGDSDFRVRPDRFMSDAAFERLQAIRAERDPDGMFCSWPIRDGAAESARLIRGGFAASYRGNWSSGTGSQRGASATKLWNCGSIPGSSSSVPSRIDTSGPSGHEPPNRLDPHAEQNALAMPPGGR